jgi:hypothetical protein
MNWYKLASSNAGVMVSCKTEDGMQLYGLWKKMGKTALFHTHGTASSFGIERFEPQLQEWACKKNGWSFLTANNRGAHELEDWQKSGAAVEKFSDSPKDFKAWIGWLQKMGIERIILSGHSLGTEKIVHFIRNHEVPHVVGIVLLAPSDSAGVQDAWEKKSRKKYMKEAMGMKERGEGDDLMQDKRVHGGLLRMTANAYLDFYKKDSELRNALPFATGKIEPLPVPVLALVPSKDKWNILNAQKYAKIIEAAGATASVCECDHEFKDFNIIDKLEKYSDLFAETKK